MEKVYKVTGWRRHPSYTMRLGDCLELFGFSADDRQQKTADSSLSLDDPILGVGNDSGNDPTSYLSPIPGRQIGIEKPKRAASAGAHGDSLPGWDGYADFGFAG